MAQLTSDFLVDLAVVTDSSVQQIRKTAESPPRVSVYDVIGLVTGMMSNNCSNILQRLADQFPEVATIVATSNFLAEASEKLL